MKKIYSLLLALIACAGTMFAESVQIGDLYYNLNADDLTAEVIKYQRGQYAGDIIIPASVDYNSVTYSVTSIGALAFMYCSGLTSITIPNSVTSIEEWAFFDCSGLTSVTIGNSVTSIGMQAFSDCSGLTSVTIPSSVTSIGAWAFSYCTGLNCISVENGNPNYCDIDGVLFNKNQTILFQYPARKIATEYIIPSSVTTIEEFAFLKCTCLTSVTIGNNVTSIGTKAFSNCGVLTSVTIPSSVTSIGTQAFWNCTGLTSVTNYAATPQTINSDVFYNVNKYSCTLYVPEGSIDLYKAANVWKNFINIQAIDTEDIDQITNNQSQITNKIIKDNQIYILTGDKTYTITGQQLK